VLKKTKASMEMISAAMFTAMKTNFGEEMTDAEIVRIMSRAIQENYDDFEGLNKVPFKCLQQESFI